MKREKKKAAGPLTGILLIVLGIGLLWWNEGNDVKNIKTIEEARSVLVNVEADKVDNANDGKLVSTNGEMVIEDEYLLDSTFNLQSPKTAKLVRVVEMLQWVEEEDEDDDGYVTYRYEKKWLTEIEDSSSFSDSSKVNPSSMPYESEEFYANNVSLGAFTLSNAQKELLSTGATVTLGDTISLPYGYYKTGNYISNVSDLANANVGTVRISFMYNTDKEISILAKQNGSSFEPYKSEQGKTLFRVESGLKTGEEIIDVVEAENNMMKWIFRIVGVLFNMAGFAALLSPIVFLAKFIPLLGNGIAKFIKVIGALVGLAVSFVVIAVAWIFFRPLIGILLLVGVVGIVFAIAMLIKKSRAVPAPEQNGMVQNQGVIQQPVMQGQTMMNQGVQQPMINQGVQQPMAQSVQSSVAQQPVNPLEQQQLQAQQMGAQQQVIQQQPQQDPMSIFGQNNNQQ